MPYKNKEDQANAAKRHYEANKDRVKDRALFSTRLARKRNRDYVNDYLKQNPCIDCGETDIIVLEFDHVRGDKENNVSTGIGYGWSIGKLKKEIDKCEVRCANCHRRITHKRRNMA